MVGLRGFEPPTSPTPRERATGLRYSPTVGEATLKRTDLQTRLHEFTTWVT